MINGFAVTPKVGIRKVVLISTSFGVSFRENQTPRKMKGTIKRGLTQ